MNPPPIGEALSAGWNATKANMVPVILGILCSMIAGIVPLLGIPGMLLVSLKAVRGQKPEPADGFAGFRGNIVDHLMMGVLQLAGMLACCIGVYVTQGVFTPGSFLVVDKGISWQQAKDRCMAEIWPNWLGWTIFLLVTGLVGGSGMILCGVGIFITLPIMTCAWAYAYEQTLAKS